MCLKPYGRDAIQTHFILLQHFNCHSDPAVAGEESRINFSTDPAQRNEPEMFRFTQHDSADEMNSKAVAASVCNLPMKRACAFEDKTEFQPVPDTTRWAHELPTTSLAYRHNQTGRKRAS